jgi:hypothetical protein
LFIYVVLLDLYTIIAEWFPRKYAGSSLVRTLGFYNFGGRKGNRFGKKEKLGYDVIRTKAHVNI